MNAVSFVIVCFKNVYISYVFNLKTAVIGQFEITMRV